MFVLYLLTITLQLNHVAFIFSLIVLIDIFLAHYDEYSKCLFEL